MKKYNCKRSFCVRTVHTMKLCLSYWSTMVL